LRWLTVMLDIVSLSSWQTELSDRTPVATPVSVSLVT
jgi:hypothetical protein